MSLLDVRGLVKYFPVRKGVFGRVVGYVKAVDGVSFSIGENEVFALVGESGSGKTTTARCILRLIEPTRGEILFMGRDVTKLKGRELKWYRRNVQAVFQNPFLSLNPRMKVKDLVAEPLKVYRDQAQDVERAVEEHLEMVGLPREVGERYPLELSGGQAQRVAIAKAIILRPRLVVLDEPTSALDVSVQAQILNLFLDLKKELKLSYLLITHDLSVVKYVSDWVAVMYLVRIVELARTEELFENPLHPYTLALLSSIPGTKKAKWKRIELAGEPPSALNPPKGCRLRPRCPLAFEKCHEEPQLVEYSKEHWVSCWLY